MRLKFLPNEFSICQLPADWPTPDWISGEFRMVCRTPDELSILCEQRFVPEQVKSSDGWIGFYVDEELSFNQIGVIARLSETLANVHVSVFVVSTFRTDFIFVAKVNRDLVRSTLGEAGYTWPE
jgi:hypothetical protein